jgi:DNA polymerase V
MIAFEAYQTVPIVSLKDMDPFMQIQLQEKAFPIPGEEFHFVRLDLSKAIIKNPSSTFFIQINVLSMIEEGYSPGDVLIVDRMMDPRSKGMSVVYLEGEFLFCRLEIKEEGISIYFSNQELEAIEIEPDMDFTIWGMVRDVLHMDGKVLE